MVKGTEGKKSNYDAAVSVCRRANPVPDTQSISCIYRSRPLNEPEQPITNNGAEKIECVLLFVPFLSGDKRRFRCFWTINKIGWKRGGMT